MPIRWLKRLPVSAAWLIIGMLVWLGLQALPDQPVRACTLTATPLNPPTPTPGPPPTQIPTLAPAALVAHAIGQADIIVVGSVARFTIGQMTIRVDEYLRGPLTASTLEVNFPIHGYDCRENPRLDEDDRVLLFLHPADREDTARLDEGRLLVDHAFLVIEGEQIRSATSQQSFGLLADAKALIGQTGPAHRPRAGIGSVLLMGGLVVLGVIGVAVYGRGRFYGRGRRE